MCERTMDNTNNPSIVEERIRDVAIEEQAYHIVDTHQHFYRRASRFVIRCDEGILMVRGSVPSFYLKQVLQNALQDLPGIRAVDNRVTVVSGEGMSSDSAG
jgi:hypothetical protein